MRRTDSRNVSAVVCDTKTHVGGACGSSHTASSFGDLPRRLAKVIAPRRSYTEVAESGLQGRNPVRFGHIVRVYLPWFAIGKHT